MGLEHRDGQTYYRRSVRRGRKVTSEYVGAGEIGVLCYLLDRGTREKSREERAYRDAHERRRIELANEENQRIRAFRGELDRQAQTVDGYFREVTQATTEVLTSLGYRRHHRGEWRRQRGSKPMGTELTKLEKSGIPELGRLARKGDLLALGMLANRFEGQIHETANDGEGYLDDTIEALAIRSLGPIGGGSLQRDAIAARMEIMRRELAPIGSGPIIELLAQRAAICWLRVQTLELDLEDFDNGQTEGIRKAQAIEQRLSRAQSRYIQALTAIAKVRRLALPVVFQQLNVAQNQKIDIGPINT